MNQTSTALNQIQNKSYHVLITVTCLSVRVLAFSLKVPVSQTQMAVLNPPVMTSLGLGQIEHKICPHSDRHSYTIPAYETDTTHKHQTNEKTIYIQNKPTTQG